ncbi:hypothetical protein AKO1_013166 [Acrasis kona]|uniref:NHL repeat containing protein n=1 Tax=Acrasis kona TaxID=1008807 RepID=A0AAW2YY24_9EUKA
MQPITSNALLYYNATSMMTMRMGNKFTCSSNDNNNLFNGAILNVCITKSNNNNNTNATQWKCIWSPNDHDYVPGRINAWGYAECLSANGMECLWGYGDLSNCLSNVQNPPPVGSMRPVPTNFNSICNSNAWGCTVYMYFQSTPTPTPTPTPIPLLITTFAGKGYSGYSGDNGPAVNAFMYNPLGMALDSTNRILYVAEQYNHVIRMIYLINNTIATFAGNSGGSSGYSGDGGLAINAKLNQPFGVAIDPVTNVLYVADKGNNCIRQINRYTNIITTFAGNATRGSGYSNGIANNSLLNGPVAIVADSNRVFISDQGNNCVRMVDKSNNMMTKIAGNGYSNRGGDNILATNSAINEPSGLCIDVNKNVLYIADQYNYAIRMVNLTNSIITTVVGSTTAKYGYNGDQNTTNVLLYAPSTIRLDPSNDLMYIMDQGNNLWRL